MALRTAQAIAGPARLPGESLGVLRAIFPGGGGRSRHPARAGKGDFTPGVASAQAGTSAGRGGVALQARRDPPRARGPVSRAAGIPGSPGAGLRDAGFAVLRAKTLEGGQPGEGTRARCLPKSWWIASRPRPATASLWPPTRPSSVSSINSAGVSWKPRQLGFDGLASLDRLQHDFPERSDPHDLSTRMRILEDVGCILVENRRFGEAEKALRESIAIAERLPDRVIPHPDLLHRIAHTNMYLGYTLGQSRPLARGRDDLLCEPVLSSSN